MNLLMIWWILGLVLLVKVEDSDGTCVKDYEVICECFSSSKTTHTIECCEDNIMSLEYSQKMLYELTDPTCIPTSSNSSCLSSLNYDLYHEDKVNMYNSCSGKKRCNITVTPSSNIKIQIPVTCKPATKIFKFIENSPTTLTASIPVFYLAGNDYIGQKIYYNCTVTTSYQLLFSVFFINLGPRSCANLKINTKSYPAFDLVCTDAGVTMFFKDIAIVGIAFSLEINGLELEKDEIIDVRLRAERSDTIVRCDGNQKYSTETVNKPTTTTTYTTRESTTGAAEKFRTTSTQSTTSGKITENREFSTVPTEHTAGTTNVRITENREFSTVPTEHTAGTTNGENTRDSITDDTGVEINPYLLFGGILAGVIVINLVCIGVFCFLRNRNKPKDTTTNVAMSNQTGNESDYSHYNYVDAVDTQSITTSHIYDELPPQHSNGFRGFPTY